jgi:pimeloyl-ACP methyl ester carboxylesterase
MDIILIPGLWLDASSWDAITPALEAAGHTVHPLTMPGTGVPAPESSEIGIQDWVDAVVAEIDAIDGPVVVVGHSGGGNVAWAAADARHDRVKRVIFVDTVPPPNGQMISEFPIEDGVIPFPGWDAFEEPEIYDIDADTRERAAARTKSVPARVPTDRVVLSNPGRNEVPVTLLMGGMDDDELRAMLGQWQPWLDAFAVISDSEVVKLGTGHWPQFTKPGELAKAMTDAVSR